MTEILPGSIEYSHVLYCKHNMVILYVVIIIGNGTGVSHWVLCSCGNRWQGLQHLLAAKLFSYLFFFINWFQNSFVGFFQTDYLRIQMALSLFNEIWDILLTSGVHSVLPQRLHSSFFLKHGTVTREGRLSSDPQHNGVDWNSMGSRAER